MAYTFTLSGIGQKTTGTTNEGRQSILNTDNNLFVTPIRNNIPRYSRINSIIAYSTVTRNIAAGYLTCWICDEWNNRIGSEFKSSLTGKTVTANADVAAYMQSETANSGEFKSGYLDLGCKFKGNATKYTVNNNRFVFTFERPTYTINVSSNNTNYGTVSGGCTKEVQTSAQTVTITATPKSGYRFVRWSDNIGGESRTITIDQNNISRFTTNLNLTAYFEPITCTATFRNDDRTPLQTVTVEYGAIPSYTGSTPTKAQDAQYTYSFSGWNPAVGPITSDVDYIAQYTRTTRRYTVRWFNEDGTLLETDSTEYGVMPTYDGATPTKAATAQFTYTFKGWHIEVATVTGAIDYYARYTETTNKYTVLWKNYDGTVLETDITEYGNIPTYDGADPTKPSTVQYSYTFFGWDTTIEEVTRDVVYIATFTEIVNKYTLNVETTEGGTVTGGGSYDYGTSVTLTATPKDGYKFVSWSDGTTDANHTITLNGNTTITATFKKIETSKVYCGTKKVSVYCGTKKVSVYCGTVKIS